MHVDIFYNIITQIFSSRHFIIYTHRWRAHKRRGSSDSGIKSSKPTLIINSLVIHNAYKNECISLTHQRHMERRIIVVCINAFKNFQRAAWGSPHRFEKEFSLTRRHLLRVEPRVGSCFLFALNYFQAARSVEELDGFSSVHQKNNCKLWAISFF